MSSKFTFANKLSFFRVPNASDRISIFVLVLAAAFWVYEGRAANAMDLSQFEWQNRLLLLFAPHSENKLFKQLQSEIGTQKYGVKDRDLVIFEVLDTGTSRMNRTPIDRREADALRHNFAVPQNSFTLILVGKDGGVKLKRSDQTSLAEIFALIDSMPMRKKEMRQKNQ